MRKTAFAVLLFLALASPAYAEEVQKVMDLPTTTTTTGKFLYIFGASSDEKISAALLPGGGGLVYVDDVKHNYGASATAPTGATDSTIGYQIGSTYTTTAGVRYWCKDATPGAAVWEKDNAYTDAEKTKLAGIASGAEVNPPLASLAEAQAGTETASRTWTPARIKEAVLAGASADGDMLKPVYDPYNVQADVYSRTNHTGTQAIATVSGLQTALDSKLGTTHASQHSAGGSDPVTPAAMGAEAIGVAAAADAAHVAAGDPHTQYVLDTQVGTSGANKILQLDGTGKLPAGLDGSQLTGLPGGGNMVAATYDPQSIGLDAFARSNHTGTQAIATVTGLQSAIDGKAATTHAAAHATGQADAISAGSIGAEVAGAATSAVSGHTGAFDHSKIPTAGEKSALAGTSGVPGDANRYVTGTDGRLSDARTPTAHTQATSTITGLDATLALKAPLASPTFTGTVGGIDKTMVGLGNVDNTADSAKPVSTVQQTALNLKANTATTVSAGVGLTGGGDLSANRTLTLGTPSTLSTSSTNSASGTTHGHAVAFPNADWAAVSGVTQILNKPTLGTAAAANTGVAIGNVPVLANDGLGNASLGIAGIDLPTAADYKAGGVALGDLIGGDSFPAQTGHNGKFLATNGTTPSWAVVASSLAALTDVSTTGAVSGSVIKYNGTSWVVGTDNTSAGAGYISTPPTYSDGACTAGQYALSDSYRWDCVTSGNWKQTALTAWSNPTPVTPTLSSAVISGAAGTTLTLTGSASLSIGAGGSGGVDLDCATAGNNIAATYASGAPGTTLVYSLATAVTSADTCNLDYTQPGNGLEATTGGADLATIVDRATTNSSTYAGGGVALTDTFDNLTNWTQVAGSWTANGTLTMPSTSNNQLRHNTDIGTMDQYACLQVKNVATWSTTRSAAIVLRQNPADGDSMSISLTNTSGVYSLKAFYHPQGSYIGGSTNSQTVTVADNDYFCAEVTGTAADPVVKAWYFAGTVPGAYGTWGAALITFTDTLDTSGITGTRLALSSGGSGGSGIIVDNWQGGSIP